MYNGSHQEQNGCACGLLVMSCPDSKAARWAHVGPTWRRQDPRWANMGPREFAVGCRDGWYVVRSENRWCRRWRSLSFSCFRLGRLIKALVRNPPWAHGFTEPDLDPGNSRKEYILYCKRHKSVKCNFCAYKDDFVFNSKFASRRICYDKSAALFLELWANEFNAGESESLQILKTRLSKQISVSVINQLFGTPFTKMN